MKQRVMQFMSGRYGTDELSKVMIAAAVALMLLSFISNWKFIYILEFSILAIIYYRSLSKNVSKRYAENQKMLAIWNRCKAQWNIKKIHFIQRKTFHFYQCPDCHQKVRVPKGKGKICITCPKCKTEFIKKS